jgi:hypothetical protein
MEVLFGEAREFTVGIILLFDWGGEEKWPQTGFVNVHESAHRPGMVDAISRYHSLTGVARGKVTRLALNGTENTVK